MGKKFLGYINGQPYLSLVGTPTVNIVYNKQVPQKQRLEQLSLNKNDKRKDEIIEEIIEDSGLQEKVKVYDQIDADYIISLIHPRDVDLLEKFMVKKGFKEIEINDTEKKFIDVIQTRAHYALEAQNRQIFHDFTVTALEKLHEMLIDLYKQNGPTKSK